MHQSKTSYGANEKLMPLMVKSLGFVTSLYERKFIGSSEKSQDQYAGYNEVSFQNLWQSTKMSITTYKLV